jgi:hypothetical protein
MANFTAQVTTSGDPASGNFAMTMTQMADSGPVDPPVDPPGNPGNPGEQPEDTWEQPPYPPQPSVQPGSTGRILRAKDFGGIAAAMNAANDGDTIAVAQDAQRESFVISKIVAVRADHVVWDFHGVPSDQLAYGGKGAIVPASAASIISGFDIAGVGLDDSRAELRAAVRVDADGYCTIEDCHFHECQNGIAAGSFNAVVEVKNTRLTGNGLPGAGGQTHNLYIGDINELTLTDVESTGPVDAHAIKFRGYRLIVDGGSYESKLGRSFDLPNGGKFTIKNATLTKPADANDGTMIGYMSEARTSGESNENTLEGCVIRAERSGGNQIVTQGGTITFAPDCQWNGTLTVSGSGTVVGLPTR